MYNLEIQAGFWKGRKKKRKALFHKYCAWFFLSRVVNARDKWIILPWSHYAMRREYELCMCQYISIVHILLLGCEWVYMKWRKQAFILTSGKTLRSPEYIIFPHTMSAMVLVQNLLPVPSHSCAASCKTDVLISGSTKSSFKYQIVSKQFSLALKTLHNQPNHHIQPHSCSEAHLIFHLHGLLSPPNIPQ